MTPDVPDCGRCGRPMVVLTWVDCTQFGDPEPRQIAGQARCDNPECPDRNWHMPDDRAWIKEQMRLVEDR